MQCPFPDIFSKKRKIVSDNTQHENALQRGKKAMVTYTKRKFVIETNVEEFLI